MNKRTLIVAISNRPEKVNIEGSVFVHNRKRVKATKICAQFASAAGVAKPNSHETSTTTFSYRWLIAACRARDEVVGTGRTLSRFRQRASTARLRCSSSPAKRVLYSSTKRCASRPR